MNAMTRFILGGVCVLGMAAQNPAIAATPDVTGLRADIYSSTAAELFWDRVPNQHLFYEVMKDGSVLSTIEGTSYFDPGRVPGATNDYTVTALDAAGVRSDSTTITVGPFGATNLQPQHLRADLYSSTAAELFWVHVPERNLTYEIMRDDGATGYTPGNSYYDGNRTPGVTNTYTVTPIDESGIRATPATIKLAPFGFESIISPKPTGLRATVYSSTAAELFWDRVPNRALRYELLRDDGLTNITNGTSYFDNRRVPGESNTYFITTIDEEGNRSAMVSIDVPAF